MNRKKRQTEASNIDATGKIIDLMVALRQSLRGLPVDGDPAKKAELDATELPPHLPKSALPLSPSVED